MNEASCNALLLIEAGDKNDAKQVVREAISLKIHEIGYQYSGPANFWIWHTVNSILELENPSEDEANFVKSIVLRRFAKMIFQKDALSNEQTDEVKDLLQKSKTNLNQLGCQILQATILTIAIIPVLNQSNLIISKVM